MPACPYCNHEVYSDSVRCVYCGRDLPKSMQVGPCSQCGTKKANFVVVFGLAYCESCALKKSESLPITTTHSLDGFQIVKYIDIESVEIVIGTGAFSEFKGDLSDIFGQRSTDFEKKMQNAKVTAFQRLKYLAFTKSANAIVGIDLDYTEFSNNRIGLIANGTLVEIKPVP